MMYWWAVALGSVLGIVAVTVVVLIVCAFIGAVIEIGNKPREDMMWCWKHGMIRKTNAVDIGSTMGVAADSPANLVCPICFQKALSDAERG